MMKNLCTNIRTEHIKDAIKRLKCKKQDGVYNNDIL